MQPGSRKDWRVQTLQVTNIFALQKDIYIGTQLAIFRAEAEAQTRKSLLEGIDDLANGATGNHDGGAIADPWAQGGREGDLDGRGCWLGYIVHSALLLVIVFLSVAVSNCPL